MLYRFRGAWGAPGGVRPGSRRLALGSLQRM